MRACLAAGVFVALVGCGGGEPLRRWSSDGAPMRHVELSLADDVRLHLDGAWVESDGDGKGEGTTVKAPALVIEGDRSEWSLSDGQVRLEGDVRVVRGEVTLTARTLVLDLAGEAVDRAEAVGQVRVTQGERVVTAGRAVLEGATGRLVLSESPRLTEGERVLTASRITVWLDEDTLNCEDCRLEMPEGALGGAR